MPGKRNPPTAAGTQRSINTSHGKKKFAPELVGLQNIQEIMDLSKNKVMTPQNAKTIVGEGSLYGLNAPITPINIPRMVTPLTPINVKTKTPKQTGVKTPMRFEETQIKEDPAVAKKMATVELMQKTKVTSGSKSDFMYVPPRSVTLAVKKQKMLYNQNKERLSKKINLVD